MLKESVICFLIVTSILIGNNITQKYTKESIQELSESLLNVRKEIIVGEEKEGTDKEKENSSIKSIKEHIKKIEEQWKNRHDKLAYYIEHNELEKIDTGLISLKSYIETKEYKDSISEIDKSIFLLKHIEDKYSFNLQNVL